ncbi:MAG TPA: hypothetical protein ENK75_00805 [Saprospiraceae bacterium]|nr:hypothetical protein [Saprospiraceae bacterium]
MAINAMLVRYKNSKEKLKEEDANNLKSCMIPEEIFNFIEEKNLVKNMKILEEDSNNEIDIRILDIEVLKELLIKIKEIVKNKSKLICNNELSNQKEDSILNELKQFLDLRGLFLEKIERYSDKNYILIQIG